MKESVIAGVEGGILGNFFSFVGDEIEKGKKGKRWDRKMKMMPIIWPIV
jgi:hypothetical protein